jgi:hypothetical protein
MRVGKVSWHKNWETCCSLGMKPLVIESEAEQKCLSDLTQGSIKHQYFLLLPEQFNLGSWSYNRNYWTAGMRIGCPGQWQWCDPQLDVYVGSEIFWDMGEPNNKSGADNCAHLRLHTNASRGARLTDKRCDYKLIFACQVSLFSA